MPFFIIKINSRELSNSKKLIVKVYAAASALFDNVFKSLLKNVIVDYLQKSFYQSAGKSGL